MLNVVDHLGTLSELCGPSGALGSGMGLALALLIAGMAGSTVHCLPMCGPIVLGQVSDRLARIPSTHLCEAHRLRNGLLLPYHLGRLTTYAALGGIGATLNGALEAYPWFAWASTALLGLAAGLFLRQAMQRVWPIQAFRHRGAPSGPSLVRASVRRIAARFTSRDFGGTFLLGVTLGFLPCGFLYGALAAATASASATTGALAMVGFGVGTVPSLVIAGIAGQAAAR